jgi:DNA processing protein
VSRSACRACLRRAWLLATLSGGIDFHRHDPQRLMALLELADEELIAAIGGTRVTATRTHYEAFDPEQAPCSADVRRICRHAPDFPRLLRDLPGAPRLLHHARGSRGLNELLAAPTVAIVGSRAASDYGMEMAWTLGRGLAAAGVTVLSGLAEGIAAGAHAGALAARGPTLTVTPGGLDVCYPANRRESHARLRATGGAVSELPCGSPVYRWCHPARARIVAGLAQVVIVVEARERAGDLIHATLARRFDRVLAAVPGRVGSTLAQGPHALLRAGATLIRGPQDVLDLLYDVGVRRPAMPAAELEPALRAVLERVGSGEDTAGKLIRAGAGGGGLLLALAELEARGALKRGDGGRYVPSGDFLGG